MTGKVWEISYERDFGKPEAERELLPSAYGKPWPSIDLSDILDYERVQRTAVIRLVRAQHNMMLTLKHRDGIVTGKWIKWPG